jgi:hypothetical protein
LIGGGIDRNADPEDQHGRDEQNSAAKPEPLAARVDASLSRCP